MKPFILIFGGTDVNENAKSESEIFARVGMKNVPPEQRKDFHEWMLQDRYIKKIEADRRARKANKLRNAKKW